MPSAYCLVVNRQQVYGKQSLPPRESRITSYNVCYTKLLRAIVLAFSGHMAVRVMFLRLTDAHALKRRVLVVGTGRRAARVVELERFNGCGHRFHVVGYLPVNGSHNDVDPSLILREDGSLESIAQKHRIDEIIVGVRERRNGNVPIIDLLERKIGGTNVIDLPTFFERETGRVQLA